MRRLSLEQVVALGPAQNAEAPESVSSAVRAIVTDVRLRGDVAVEAYRARLDAEASRKWPDFAVPKAEREAALVALDPKLRAALAEMVSRVSSFAHRQLSQLQAFSYEVVPGVRCAQRVKPLTRVACYVPAGQHALPSTAIMTALTARTAGVSEVIVVCPRPSPVVLAACELARADRVLAVGGAHGVAALAVGTRKIPRVDLICGPGGVWVAEAKRQLGGVVGTDLPAGPSEVMVLADDSADFDLVLADLLAQAEHDPAARPLLGTTSLELAEKITRRVKQGFAEQPNQEAIEAALKQNGLICVCRSRMELAELADALAPEHLAMHVRDPEALLENVHNFGAAFLGGRASEVFGDYGAGPNHVLPTGGAARYTGGLSVFTFLRVQTILEMTPSAAAALAAPTALIARAEGLEAHAAAAELRARRAAGSDTEHS
ncbi:MAG: histidinol dehydrogenase [Candidatus Schekmanbacteria bacterium]|nr:histidinol dehydrogenase [Candidatus Schekmanbacteria bacterium]